MHTFHSTATALVAVIVIAACGPATSGPPEQSGTPAGADVSSPTGASAPAPEPTDGEASAVAAYRDMWQAFADAAATGDWTSAGMAQYASGEALSTLTQGIKADHDRGWISRGQPILAPSVTAATPADDPREVMVSDCGDSTNWIRYESGSGLPVPDDPRGRRRIEAIVTKQADGAWRVVKFAVSGIGTC